MSGPRYEGELFVRYEGNREAGRRYLPEARKVLGYVLQDAEVNSLGVHKMRHVLSDGTVIVAEKIGDLKRVTIEPPFQPGGKKPIRIFEDLVMSAGAASYNEGDFRVIPPIIASPKEGGGWGTYFFSADSPGYSDAAAGVYSDVYPEVETKREVLPEASRNWYNDKGEFCAWATAVYHNAPAYRHPDSLYGVLVQRLGRLAFASTFYIDSEGASLPWRYVMCAAFRGEWLYMVMSDLGPLLYTPRPAEGAMMGDAWASETFANTAFEYALVRVRQVEKTDPVTKQVYYEAEDGSHEVLWTASLERAYSAWTFNRDLTECVSYQMPEQSVIVYREGVVDDSLIGGGVRFALSLAHDDSDGSVSVSFATSAAGAVVFEDNGSVLSVEKVGSHSYDYVGPAYSCPAYRWDGLTETIRELVYADVVNNKYAFHEIRTTLNEGAGTKAVEFSGIVVEDGVETEVVTGSEPTAPYSDLEFEMEGIVRNYVESLGVEGLTFAYRGVGGCVIMRNEPPGSGTWELAGIIRTSMLIPIVLSQEVAGVANGGISVTTEFDTDGPWPWTIVFGAGPGNSTEPSYTGVYQALYTAGVCQSTANFLMVSNFLLTSDAMLNYITGADLVELLNSAFPANFVLGAFILGKPPLTQKYEAPL